MQYIYLCFPCCLLLLWWTPNQIPYSCHKNSLDLPHFPWQPYFLNQAQTLSPPSYIPVILQVTKSWWLVHISNEILAPFTNNCSISQGVSTFCGSVLFLQLNLYLRARTLLFVIKTLQNLKSYRELICCCESVLWFLPLKVTNTPKIVSILCFHWNLAQRYYRSFCLSSNLWISYCFCLILLVERQHWDPIGHENAKMYLFIDNLLHSQKSGRGFHNSITMKRFLLKGDMKNKYSKRLTVYKPSYE